MQAMNELKISVERIETHLRVREKGTILTQSHRISKEQLETNTNSSTHPHVEHVQAITTLRSGKTIKKSEPVKAIKPNDPADSKSDGGLSNAP